MIGLLCSPNRHKRIYPEVVDPGLTAFGLRCSRGLWFGGIRWYTFQLKSTPDLRARVASYNAIHRHHVVRDSGLKSPTTPSTITISLVSIPDFSFDRYPGHVRSSLQLYIRGDPIGYLVVIVHTTYVQCTYVVCTAYSCACIYHLP